jgi:hypothetical protein
LITLSDSHMHVRLIELSVESNYHALDVLGRMRDTSISSYQLQGIAGARAEGDQGWLIARPHFVRCSYLTGALR